MKPLPCKLSYIKVTDIISFIPTPDNRVLLESATPWNQLPIVKGTLTIQTQSKTTTAGQVYTSNISATIKAADYKIPTEAVIICIDYDNAESKILGTPDIPIRFSGTNEQYKDVISLEYTNSHPPLLLQL